MTCEQYGKTLTICRPSDIVVYRMEVAPGLEIRVRGAWKITGLE